jgi:hypothetical protein
MLTGVSVSTAELPVDPFARRDFSELRGERGSRVPICGSWWDGPESVTCSAAEGLCFDAVLTSRLPTGTDAHPVTPMTSPTKQRVVTQ